MSFQEAKRENDSVIYHPNNFVHFDGKYMLSVDEICDAITYAIEECDNTNPRVHTNSSKIRSSKEIFFDQLTGKLGEFATYEATKKINIIGRTEYPDINAMGRGAWDKGDLTVPIEGKNATENWQVKTPDLPYSQFLLLETNAYDFDGNYKYSPDGKEREESFDKFVLQRIDYDKKSELLNNFFSHKDEFLKDKNSIKNKVSAILEKYHSSLPKVTYEIPYYISKQELKNEVIKRLHIMSRNQHFAASLKYKGKGTVLQDTNYYVEVSNMHNLVEMDK